VPKWYREALFLSATFEKSFLKPTKYIGTSHYNSKLPLKDGERKEEEYHEKRAD